MTYQQTIDYMYAQLPMFSRIGSAAYKKDLHNTIELCNALGNPEKKIRSIHIAGTNGKGSTSHMLAAILQNAGYKTGLYTSPHLKDFRERIKINGKMIKKAFVIDFVKRTKKLSEEISPSFFELTVAMAFDYFVKEKVDIAIIETGLGGRLDSTNVITPLLSVITNIGYDHMNILGNSLESISAEKAGIIKPGVPVVIGEYLPETLPVFEKKAKETGSEIYLAQDMYFTSNTISKNHTLKCTVNYLKEGTVELFTLDLNGLYQAKNLLTVICSVKILRQQGFIIKNEDKKYALAHVKKLTGLHGRWDVIATKPLTVLDVAHNEDGIKQVLEQINLYKTNSKRFSNFHFIIGMVKDKEVDKVLSLLPADARYYFTNAHTPRALKADELQAKASAYNLKGEFFDDVNDAMQSAKDVAASNDLILVFGSVFLIGEVNT